MIEALPQELIQLRAQAKEVRDPTAPDETLDFLLETAKAISVKRVLEIGAAEGLTTTALLLLNDCTVTAIERDGERAQTARRNFEAFGVEKRVNLIEGDAGEVLPALEEDGTYDLIFLDGPKVQYRRYFSDCKRLLKRGGYLLSDDVLLFGYITGAPPQKRRALAEHIHEYIKLLQNDSDFVTNIFPLGEGLAVSRKL